MSPMLRWFVFTIAMGLLTFGFSVLLQLLRGVPSGQWQNSPELLFFSVMVSASELDGILAATSSEPERRGGWRTFLTLGFGWFLISAIVAAALYGIYLDQGRSDPGRVVGSGCVGLLRQVSAPPETAGIRQTCTEWLAFQGNLFTFSLWMAVVVGATGTFTEWIRTRRQP